MRFAYYERLSARDQRIYRKSDRVTALLLPDAPGLGERVDDLRAALAGERRAQVQRAANALAREILAQLAVPGLQVKVLSRRPSTAESELHGLYERDDDGMAQITVWMRTAAKKKVVAFRTFVRTLLHEICHHLDYDHLKLADSFHTRGFFQREASLARQLLTEPVERAPTRTAAKRLPRPPRTQQLELPFGR